MGLFDAFNANKRKWMNIQANPDLDSQLKVIIRDFFILDNIIVEMYMENQRANETTEVWSGGLEMWEGMNRISTNPEPPIRCSKTFKQHFSNDRFNRGLQTPDWFYIAYPDVAHWFHKNFAKFETEMESREDELFGEDGIRPVFFREIIESFKAVNGKLECTA
jgi:hypothetical protein